MTTQPQPTQWTADELKQLAKRTRAYIADLEAAMANAAADGAHAEVAEAQVSHGQMSACLGAILKIEAGLPCSRREREMVDEIEGYIDMMDDMTLDE